MMSNFFFSSFEIAAITVPSGVEISPISLPTIFSGLSDDFAIIS
ncbi:MAG: hypothetical protein CM15mP22_2290 [Gammaproteobacteria bacterium]|nr:MAG: hypothetical protein CM15mP22_2290 [Gammaproteobacteria bacterium]